MKDYEPSHRSSRYARLLSLVYLLSFPFAPTANAKDAPNISKPSLVTLMTINGECRKLVVPGRDFTAECKPVFVNKAFSDGRVGFVFLTNNDAVITFSGSTKQVNPDAYTALQAVDRITFMFQNKTENTVVVGSCRYTNPYAGKATVACQAEASGGGVYTGDFISDGKEPVNLLKK